MWGLHQLDGDGGQCARVAHTKRYSNCRCPSHILLENAWVMIPARLPESWARAAWFGAGVLKVAVRAYFALGVHGDTKLTATIPRTYFCTHQLQPKRIGIKTFFGEKKYSTLKKPATPPFFCFSETILSHSQVFSPILSVTPILSSYELPLLCVN